MNVNQPNITSWHAMYSVNDRQKVVQILTATLKEIQNSNYDGQKAALIAQEFEKHTFMKSLSRDEYLRVIKQRITQLRSGIRNANGMNNASGVSMGANANMGSGINMGGVSANGLNMNNMSNMNTAGANSGSNFNMGSMANPSFNLNNMNGMGNQNFNMNMNMNGGVSSSGSNNMNMNMNNVNNIGTGAGNNMNNNMNNNINNNINNNMSNNLANNGTMNNMNMNNSTFLQQQAQARQQSAAQIQANQMRNMGQNAAGGAPAAGQQLANASVPTGLAPQTLNQQQVSQITNMLRNVPIPQALLAKIPSLPPNVNTWTQIFDCFQKKMIPPSAMPIIKEIHNTHLQLAIRQHQQRKMSQHPQQMNNTAQTGQPQNRINNQNFNMNQQKPPAAAQPRQSPQQTQQFMQRQVPGPNGQAQPAQMNQQIQNGANNAQAAPANINQRLPAGQNGKPPNFNITPQDVLKYSSDAMMLLRRLQANGSIQGNLDHNQRENFVKKYIIHQKTLQWRQQNGQTTNNNPNIANTNANPNSTIPNNNANNPQMRMQNNMNIPNQTPQPLQSNQLPLMNNKPQPMVSPVMNQRIPQVPAGAPAQQINGNLPQQGAPPVANQQMNQKPNGAMNTSSLASILPPLTDEMKVKLRQLIEEVSRNNVALKDVSNLLSQSDKTVVRDIMAKISQHYANVDSIVSYFFILTRNVEGTKRLIQMKYMTKSIMENLQRGSYLASPDLAEKLRAQYTKYFDYVREQFSIRRQQMQQLSGQQPQQQQQQPANVQQNQQMRPMPNQQNPMAFQKQQLPSSQSPQISNQQFANQPVMMQKWNQQQQQQQTQQQQQPVQQRSSPVVNNQGSPMIPQGLPQRQTGKTTNSKKGANATTGRRKSTKNASVGSIPTPSAIATTPASLANTIKTPNSIPTPQVPQTQSNKNTPTAQSPSFNRQASFKLSESTLGDIFSADKASTGDAELNKRRELSNQDPEKFFLASLANLLEVDGSSEPKSLPTPSPSLNGHKVNGLSSSLLKSPLSPVIWTATIRPEAITTSFRQVDSIRELTSMDILEICNEMGQQQTVQAVKREREFDDMELLFSEDKKPKINDQFAFMYNENIGFDEWKSMITTSME